MTNSGSKQAQQKADEEENRLNAEIAQQQQTLAIQKRKAQKTNLTNLAVSLGSNSGFEKLGDDEQKNTPRRPNTFGWIVGNIIDGAKKGFFNR